MNSIIYRWTDGEQKRDLALVHVRGTQGVPYHFGDPAQRLSVDLRDFFIGVVPVTQSFWSHIVGAENNPALNRGPDLPIENVSWDALNEPGGFLQRLNESPVAASVRGQADPALEFRLPTETEWEYAARGGPHWRDGYQYSGGNDIDAVAWYDRKHGDHTQPVARKAPNQLGIYDMSGNVWEWCQDTFSRDLRSIPTDGTPCRVPGSERVLRGGCFHNWAAHCTVSKRYEIARESHDGCIGFRVVLAAPRPSTRPGA
jgi:formylglycine-generating enzyme